MCRDVTSKYTLSVATSKVRAPIDLQILPQTTQAAPSLLHSGVNLTSRAHPSRGHFTTGVPLSIMAHLSQLNTPLAELPSVQAYLYPLSLQIGSCLFFPVFDRHLSSPASDVARDISSLSFRCSFLFSTGLNRGSCVTNSPGVLHSITRTSTAPSAFSVV